MSLSSDVKNELDLDEAKTKISNPTIKEIVELVKINMEENEGIMDNINIGLDNIAVEYFAEVETEEEISKLIEKIIQSIEKGIEKGIKNVLKDITKDLKGITY